LKFSEVQNEPLIYEIIPGYITRIITLTCSYFLTSSVLQSKFGYLCFEHKILLFHNL